MPEPRPEAGDLTREIDALVARLTGNVEKSAERLDKQDAGDPTRQVQRDIIKDLDALIEQKQRQNQQSSADSQGSPSQGKDQQSARQRRKNRSSQASRGEQSARRRQNGPAPKTPSPSGQGPANVRAEREGLNRIADLYKDIWGHLAESLRLEMDQYGREQFMAKYGDLIKQYYATVAEKGRKKGE